MHSAPFWQGFFSQARSVPAQECHVNNRFMFRHVMINRSLNKQVQLVIGSYSRIFNKVMVNNGFLGYFDLTASQKIESKLRGKLRVSFLFNCFFQDHGQ